ncbi:hypothetical protein H0H92_000499, partial [Tricholoma furcatifolium]
AVPFSGIGRDSTISPQVASLQPSPIGQLPTELLVEILVAAVCDKDASSRTPYDLLKVCKRWHACTLDTPTIWSTITVDEKLERDTSRIEREVKRVKMFLRLSKTRPLTIDLIFMTFLEYHDRTPNSDTDLPYFKTRRKFQAIIGELAESIAQHAHRIKEFKLLIDEYPTTAAFSALCKACHCRC